MLNTLVDYNQSRLFKECQRVDHCSVKRDCVNAVTCQYCHKGRQRLPLNVAECHTKAETFKHE